MTEGGDNDQGRCEGCGFDPADCVCHLVDNAPYRDARDKLVRGMNLVRLYINDDIGLGKVFAIKGLRKIAKEMDEFFPGWRDEDV